MTFDTVTLFDYQATVRIATGRYLNQLTAEKLISTVEFHGQGVAVAQILPSLVIHLVGHAGEIAALKGVQGVKGLPF